MSTLLSLAVFSGLSVNLILQFALGLRGAALEERISLPFFQMGVLFCVVLFLWAFFFYVLSPLGLGFLEYPALFPLAALGCSGLERLFNRFFSTSRSASRLFNAVTAYDGLALAASFIVLDAAASFADALILSLGFSLGILFSLLLLREIRIRSALEKVPPFLRGAPLTLISAGILSLIFSSTALVFFRVLKAF